MFVVVMGTPFDGMNCHGPFSSTEDAEKWAEDAQNGGNWWVIRVHKPT